MVGTFAYEVVMSPRRWFLLVALLPGVIGAILGELSSPIDTNNFDASEVIWAHAVNSRKRLNEALEGPIDFLEADVSLGRVTGLNVWGDIPIMAHPPLKYSDISLEDWFSEVVSRGNNSKGVKLDFKSTNIVNASLLILQKWKDQITFPLWLNADILPGPVNATALPVDAETFLSLCRLYFPKATLSIGWTTLYSGSEQPEDLRYSWNDVWTMARAIRCAEIPDGQGLTFPIRGLFVKNSLPQLLWLVRTFPSSSITIWTGIFDPLEIKSLLALRRLFPASKVYYDLPDFQRDEFMALKQNETYQLDRSLEEEHLWGVLRDSDEPFGCDDATSKAGSTILYGGRRPVAAFLDKPLTFPLEITGKLYPYVLSDYVGNYSTREGVVAIIAAKSKEFWSEGVWRDDYNSTMLAIGVGDPDHIKSCCSVNFAVHFDQWQSSPTQDLSVKSCHYHETCKVYSDSSFKCPALSSNQQYYVGFVFKGDRALVLADVNIKGTPVFYNTNGQNRQVETQLFALLTVVAWTLWTRLSSNQIW